MNGKTVYKYIDQDNTFVCIYKCGFSIGHKSMQIRYKSNLIKTYNIGIPVNTIDLSKTHFIKPSFSVTAGNKIYARATFYDVYNQLMHLV